MSSKKGLSLTSRELEIMALTWQCFASEPTVDYTKLAALGNFKNANSARACFAPVKKKLMETAASTPASPKKRKAPTPTATGDAGRGLGTPKKTKTDKVVAGPSASAATIPGHAGLSTPNGDAVAARHVQIIADDDHGADDGIVD